ncbi:TIGR01244 family sulfur transferase [Paracoccus sediminicola]|uniref:TIGR01244 family sulfur transferase n=1 Tax=Paracoccus sediminicola TaxID=3017783 RepID=UPI0022F01CD1|nr:TIGR01244 family sulfur transferase [Paracoccus sediminicola]WBU57687.1 TIGR01244 family sulfur transferase [Paracoccus sediminicola]
MDIRKINDRISVSPQIDPADLAELAKAGYRSVICNRPDGEEAGQPGQDQIAEAAKAAGLEFRALPVVPGQLDAGLVSRFGEALDEMPQPILAYCRSGTRSATVWALSQSGKQPRQDILRMGRDAGYDLGGIAEALHDPE